MIGNNIYIGPPLCICGNEADDEWGKCSVCLHEIEFGPQYEPAEVDDECNDDYNRRLRDGFNWIQ